MDVCFSVLLTLSILFAPMAIKWITRLYKMISVCNGFCLGLNVVLHSFDHRWSSCWMLVESLARLILFDYFWLYSFSSIGLTVIDVLSLSRIILNRGLCVLRRVFCCLHQAWWQLQLESRAFQEWANRIDFNQPQAVQRCLDQMAPQGIWRQVAASVAGSAFQEINPFLIVRSSLAPSQRAQPPLKVSCPLRIRLARLPVCARWGQRFPLFRVVKLWPSRALVSMVCKSL